MISGLILISIALQKLATAWQKKADAAKSQGPGANHELVQEYGEVLMIIGEIIILKLRGKSGQRSGGVP